MGCRLFGNGGVGRVYIQLSKCWQAGRHRCALALVAWLCRILRLLLLLLLLRRAVVRLGACVPDRSRTVLRAAGVLDVGGLASVR